MKTIINTGTKLNRIIGLALVVILGFVALLDSPEGAEKSLLNKERLEANRSSTDRTPLNISIHEKLESVSTHKKRKLGFFDEDYILAWLSPSRVRSIWAVINGDISTAKFKSFFSRGNLSPRHLSLARYRDFLDMNIQQYGRSIH